MPLLLLISSLIALIVGPALFPLFERRRHLYRLLDGFIIVVIAGIVLIEVMPEVLAHNALAGLVLLCIGLLGPTILERLFHKVAGQVHRTAIIIGIIGLIAHAFVDGIVLCELPTVNTNGENLLGIGVVLHRLPVGFTIWWLLRPRYGLGAALTALSIMMIGTVGGYVIGPEIGYLATGNALILFQALAAGTILHVVIHRPHESPAPPNSSAPAWFFRWAEGIGNVLGLGVLALLIWLHPGHVGDHAHLNVLYGETGHIFWGMALESAPALLLAYFAGGMLGTLMPTASIRWMRRGPALARSVKGVVVGLPLPICTCGVLPLYRSLIDKGAPATAAMAFLIATPELGIDALLISIPLLGGDMTLVRLAAAGLIALSVGWVVGRWAERLGGSRQEEVAESVDGTQSVKERVVAGFKEGFGGLVDDTAPWILLGLFVAALAHPILGQGWLQQLPPTLEVLLFALIGLPIYVCASGATPIVAVMLINGISPGAALAFLLTGPATNVSTYGILSRVHNRKIAILFGAATALVAVALGYAVNALAPQLTLLSAADLDLEHTSLFQQICLIILLSVFLASLIRRGARGFVGEILAGFQPAHTHDHEQTESREADSCSC